MTMTTTTTATNQTAMENGGQRMNQQTTPPAKAGWGATLKGAAWNGVTKTGLKVAAILGLAWAGLWAYNNGHIPGINPPGVVAHSEEGVNEIAETPAATPEVTEIAEAPAPAEPETEAEPDPVEAKSGSTDPELAAALKLTTEEKADLQGKLIDALADLKFANSEKERLAGELSTAKAELATAETEREAAISKIAEMQKGAKENFVFYWKDGKRWWNCDENREFCPAYAETEAANGNIGVFHRTVIDLKEGGKFSCNGFGQMDDFYEAMPNPAFEGREKAKTVTCYRINL